jgi:hypothetical protein
VHNEFLLSGRASGGRRGDDGVWLRVRILNSFTLQLQDYCVCNARLLLRGSPGLLRQPPYQGLRFRQRYIVLEAILSGYRLRGAVRNDRAVVDSASQLVEAEAMADERVY